METGLRWLVQLATPAVLVTAALFLAVAARAERGHPGWWRLSGDWQYRSRILLRAGWALVGVTTLVVYFAWPEHPVAEVVAGPDRAQQVIRLFNVGEYRMLGNMYDGYGAVAEPLLCWLWAGWLLLVLLARLLFGLTVSES